MGRDVHWGGVAPTSGEVGGGTPPLFIQREEHWRHFDNSVNAVSFGFVATAILISMFLIMAIFEKFLRPRSTPHSSSSEAVGGGGGRNNNHIDLDHQSQMGFNSKLGFPSPKMSIYSRGVSVLMPGDKIPTFIAHLVPVPCPPERVFWPHHQQKPSSASSSSSSSNAT